MLVSRFSTFLCASLALGAASARADDANVFVVQLRLPARGMTLDVFAARTANGIEAPGNALASLGLAAPASDALVPLSSIPGLSFTEIPNDSAIVIDCTAVCYERQSINLRRPAVNAETVAEPFSGGYLNYEAELQWIDDGVVTASGIGEASFFGRWGLLESSWLGQATENTRFTRLETSWTIDAPRHGVRTRFGDSVMINAAGVPMRFGGIQIGRYFGLTPSMITYPTPALSGEAESASTIELYVDGVLRARSDVAAGPFVIDHAPVVSGSGEAELIVTDVLGRQQTITRPFFVDTSMLRPGLSDWSVALGAERRAFGSENARYGDSFAAVRYRRGIAESLTVEAAIEATGDLATAQIGASVASIYFGEAHVSHAANSEGDYTAASWYYDGRSVGLGLQFQQRGGAFAPLGQDRIDGFRHAIAGNVAFDLGDRGAVAFTAAEIEFDNEPRSRTLNFSYTPDFGDGAMSFRLIHTDREDEELSAAVSFSFALGDDVSARTSAEYDRNGVTYRASAQRAVEPDHFGWRARAMAGANERIEGAAMARTGLGDTTAEAGVANGIAGVRVRHAGSVGWIENVPFAGRRIDGAFVLVDSGAPHISIARNRFDAGETGHDGRHLVTNVQPYRATTISISTDDLPLDRAPASPSQQITVAEGSGALVRFTNAAERTIETRITFADSSAPPRGAVLVRTRDGRRFPIGSDGRVVIQGAQRGDIVSLRNCAAAADEDAAERGLILECEAMS